jgi:hypothetical protein
MNVNIGNEQKHPRPPAVSAFASKARSYRYRFSWLSSLVQAAGSAAQRSPTPNRLEWLADRLAKALNTGWKTEPAEANYPKGAPNRFTVSGSPTIGQC